MTAAGRRRANPRGVPCSCATSTSVSTLAVSQRASGAAAPPALCARVHPCTHVGARSAPGPLSSVPADLKEIFDRYRSLRDIYIPQDFYTK